MFIPSVNSTTNFKGFTLIMPVVAVGNVAQLAVDLLVSTFNMRRVGYLFTDCLVPMAGNNPYPSCRQDEEELSTNAEVYTAAELNLAVLQIRAPVLQRKSKQFRQLLISWIRTSGFSRTLVLSSSFSSHRDDQQLQGSPLRYLMTPALRKLREEEQKEVKEQEEAGWRELERVSAFPGITDTETRIYIPGGGITTGLYLDSCVENLPLAVLLVFCSEGDNVPDAFALVGFLNEWLHLLDNPSQDSNKWKIPSSWSLLFGSGFPPALF